MTHASITAKRAARCCRRRSRHVQHTQTQQVEGRVDIRRGATLCVVLFRMPPPNEVGYRRGTIRGSHGPFPLPSSRTGLDPFGVIRLSGPCFRNDAVDVPAWISSCHLRHTTDVLRRLAAICLTYTGFSFRPGFSRSASLRMWCTSTFSFDPQSSHWSARTL
jgi:hypothetical protein